MRILIETVPHSAQRYDTVGDWMIESDGTWHIRVSEFPQLVMREGIWRYPFLVALHELLEMALCLGNGTSVQQVDKFDLTWEPHDGITEPGDDIAAPYYQEHQIASALERFMAVQLGLIWSVYDQACNSIGEMSHAEGHQG